MSIPLSSRRSGDVAMIQLVVDHGAEKSALLRRVAGIALVVGALSAVVVVVQAVALAHVVDRSLLHHAPLGTLVPAIVIVGLAIGSPEFQRR